MMIPLLALSLGVDAFAVSISCGMSPGFRKRYALWLGIYFGGFQALMTLLGALLGHSFNQYVAQAGSWIAFVLLTLIGGNMVWRALKGNQKPDETMAFSHKRLFVLAIATSIDAFAAGVSLALLTVNLAVAAAVIGGVAFALSVSGGLFGKRVGETFHKRAELVGGIVLIALGIRSLF
ncbi:MAG: manganese efflux pump MntP family protein [Oscillospiraceae bacterium]|nr:manganese efflux pump MntP family protein [Oscillospiraceae bacterium]